MLGEKKRIKKRKKKGKVVARKSIPHEYGSDKKKGKV